MSKLTNAEKDKLDNTCGNLRVTKLGTHVKTLEDFVNEGVLDTRANTVVEAINELYGMIVNKDCEGITIPPPGFFTLFGNDEDGKLYCYYNDKDHPPLFRHVETPGELEGTLYLYIADPEGDNHFEMEIGHYIAVRHLDNYYTKSQCDAKYPVTVEKQSTATSGYAATYVVKQNGSQVGTKIDIPKDFFLKGGSVKTCTTANNPVQGYAVGDKYLDMEINVQDGTATTKHMYILLRDLAPLYSADESTLTLSSNNVFSVKNGGISSVKIANGAVTTDKIASSAVTNDKINSVNGSKVIDSNAHSNIGSSANANQNAINTAIDTKISKLATKEQVDNIIAGDIDLTGYLKDDVGTVKSSNIADGTIVDGDIASSTISHKKLEKSTIWWAPSGYTKILRIKINNTWVNTPICFEIHRRGINKPINCSLMFTGADTKDPELSANNFVTDTNGAIYAYKESASTWAIIVPAVNNDVQTIRNLRVGDYAYQTGGDSFTFTYLSDTGVSLPSSTTSNPLIQATYIIADNLTTDDNMRCLSAKQGKTLKSLVDGKITNGTGTVTSTNIADKTIVAGDIADKTIVNGNIADKTITGGKLVDGTITATQLASNSVTSAKISDKSVTNAKLAPAVFHGNGGSTSAGYVKMIKFVVSAAWSDKPITFDLYNRTRKDNIHVSLKFKNDSETDPEIDFFSYTSYDSVNLYAYKEATSTWSIIVQKEANGNFEISNLIIPEYLRSTLSYANMNTHISALPSGTSTTLIQATQRTYGGTSNNNITAPAFIKSGGKASEFLKANGTVDTNSYSVTGHTHTKSQITDFPTSMTPTSHSHGYLTNDGKLGTEAGKPLMTCTDGKICAGSFGTSAKTVCEGNDSRIIDLLSNTVKISFRASNSINSGIINPMNLSISKGSNIYIGCADLNGNAKTDGNVGILVNGVNSIGLKPVSNGIASATINYNAGTYFLTVCYFDSSNRALVSMVGKLTVT